MSTAQFTASILQMESNSDSDGSHISTTPPRRPNQSTPPPTIVKSNKSRIKFSASSHSNSMSKHKKTSSKPTKPPSNSEPSLQDPPSNPPSLPTLPFQIRQPFNQNRATAAVDSIENLPAGFFSKVASFSKIRRPSLNFESVETNDPVSSNSETQTEISETNNKRVNRVEPEIRDEATNSGNSAKVAKRVPIGLIGGNVSLRPVKLQKTGVEGNFVRLNLKKNKRKFTNKGQKKRSYSSNGRRFYKRSKKNLKPQAEDETESIDDDDGLAMEVTRQKQREETGRAKFSSGVIEEAVLGARNVPSDENLVKLLKLMYGHNSFRDGQLEAIKMVLSGKSTMLVLPTGAGKSLCYQIPALILPGLTLVVSPLVALMIDQLKQLPPMIQGAVLSSSQRPEEVAETMRLLLEGTIKVLFVSPERFLSADFLSIFMGASSISLLVVDEAHCISEWSHNFRPSYMRLRASLLRARLNVECILAMTATATTTTLQAVMSALEITSSNLIQKAHLRDNLQLSVSLSGNRMKELLTLLKSSPFKEVESIIIYCKFQFETDLISRYLRDNNISAKGYHSGIPAKDRSHIQELFCSNKIKVVVATVAFGMGLDKGDVGAVIHYSLPESLEEYVQEIGRAGRDGRFSYCHLLFDDITYFMLRSLMYSDGVDEYVVNKFLCEVFTSDVNSPGKIHSIVKESASRKYDMKEEVILTLLTQLELGDVQYLLLLPQLNVTCTLNFHKTSPGLLAAKDTLVASILKKSENTQGQYVFDIPTVANSIGVTTTDLSNQLHNLKLKGEITYEVKDLAYCYTVIEVPGDICSLTAQLTKWLSEVEHCKVRKLDTVFNAVSFAVNKCKKMNGCSGAQHTPCLQDKIFNYFKGEDNLDASNKLNQNSPFLRADIKVFLQSNAQAKFTPRAVARIMHGISSPAYPSFTWSKTHFWGRYAQTDFQVVMEAAKAELLNFVRKDSL